MLDKLKTITKTRFKRTNFDAFLAFLLFAVFIWIIVQFSKEYNEIIDIPVEYINIPKDKLILKDNPDVLKLKMETTGFKLAYISLLPPTLFIDVSKTRQENGRLIYLIDENRNEIQSQLNIDFGNSLFLKEALVIQYRQRKEKTLRVVSKIEVEFAVGYSAADNLSIEPDSITVSGPDNILDTLNQLKTVPLTLKDIKNDISGKVSIDTTNFSNITLYQKQVAYFMDVEKYTEGNMKIPVELLNVPEDLNVVIFPKETLLFYKVNLKDYKDITVSDFQVVADFKELKENQDFLIPKTAKKPETVSNVRLSDKRIHFIIKK